MAAEVGAQHPPPPPPPKPQPPQIPYKFIGYIGPADNKVAVLHDGTDILMVRRGEELPHGIKVLEIGYEIDQVRLHGSAVQGRVADPADEQARTEEAMVRRDSLGGEDVQRGANVRDRHHRPWRFALASACAAAALLLLWARLGRRLPPGREELQVAELRPGGGQFLKALARQAGQHPVQDVAGPRPRQRRRGAFHQGSEYLKHGLLEEAIASTSRRSTSTPRTSWRRTKRCRKRSPTGRSSRNKRTGTSRSAKSGRTPGRDAPRLNPQSNIPIVLRFRDEGPKKIYDALSKASGHQASSTTTACRSTRRSPVDIAGRHLQQGAGPA